MDISNNNNTKKPPQQNNAAANTMTRVPLVGPENLYLQQLLAQITEMLKTIKTKEERYNLLMKLGCCHALKRNFFAAQNVLREALTIIEEKKNYVQICYLRCNLASLAMEVNNQDEAIQEAETCMFTARTRLRSGMTCDTIIGTAQALQGMVYAKYSEHEKAVSSFTHALLLARKYKSVERESMLLGLLAASLKALLKWDEAEHALHKQLTLALECNKIKMQISAHSNLSQLYEQTRSYDRAIRHSAEALQLEEWVQQGLDGYFEAHTELSPQRREFLLELEEQQQHDSPKSKDASATGDDLVSNDSNSDDEDETSLIPKSSEAVCCLLVFASDLRDQGTKLTAGLQKVRRKYGASMERRVAALEAGEVNESATFSVAQRGCPAEDLSFEREALLVDLLKRSGEIIQNGCVVSNTFECRGWHIQAHIN